MNSSGCTHMCEDCDQLCIAKAVKFIVIDEIKLPIVSGSVEPLDIDCKDCQNNVV